MGKKKSPCLLIVGDDPELFRAVAENSFLPQCTQKRVKHCEKALEIASEDVPVFDFLITDLATPKVNDEDFAEQYVRLSPATQVIFTIF